MQKNLQEFKNLLTNQKTSKDIQKPSNTNKTTTKHKKTTPAQTLRKGILAAPIPERTKIQKPPKASKNPQKQQTLLKSQKTSRTTQAQTLGKGISAAPTPEKTKIKKTSKDIKKLHGKTETLKQKNKTQNTAPAQTL